MLTARLLKQPKIVIRNYNDISHTDLLKLLRARKQKKYGFQDVAYEVEPNDKGMYNVRMEYIAKEY